ncbi:hypothetical protein NM208_g13383 [Fusarium decemcellulare]|uniref:Uncharacterized protein n=1 Tax=Fusarium decemcellulare TaxID=57161 RepID=A0ACC1RKS0_9HYPO|nr:hypothetical protein NM208_g13383 [Fusarium decemcellulare]
MAYFVAPPPLVTVAVVALLGIRFGLARSSDKSGKPGNMLANKWLQMGKALADNTGVHFDAAPEGSRSLCPGDVGVVSHLLDVAESDTRNNHDPIYRRISKIQDRASCFGEISRHSRGTKGEEKTDGYPLLQGHVQAVDQGDREDDNYGVADNVEDRLGYGKVDDTGGSACFLRMAGPGQQYREDEGVDDETDGGSVEAETESDVGDEAVVKHQNCQLGEFLAAINVLDHLAANGFPQEPRYNLPSITPMKKAKDPAQANKMRAIAVVNNTAN